MREYNHNDQFLHDDNVLLIQERRDLLLVSNLPVKFSKDGDQYCWLLGDDLQTGIAGYGDTPNEAMHDFNKAFFATPSTQKGDQS